MADDDRTLFIEAMPDPIRRRIAFDVVERNCRMRFGVGEEASKPIFEYLAMFNHRKSPRQLKNLRDGSFRCLTKKRYKVP